MLSLSPTLWALGLGQQRMRLGAITVSLGAFRGEGRGMRSSKNPTTRAILRASSAAEAELPKSEADRFKSDEGSKIARAWAMKGRTAAIVLPKRYENTIVYHGLKEGHERKGFGFVTRSRPGAEFHGKLQAFRIRPGAKIYPDLEASEAIVAERGDDPHDALATGIETLFEQPESSSAGVVHFEDLFQSKEQRMAASRTSTT